MMSAMRSPTTPEIVRNLIEAALGVCSQEKEKLHCWGLEAIQPALNEKIMDGSRIDICESVPTSDPHLSQHIAEVLEIGFLFRSGEQVKVLKKAKVNIYQSSTF